MTSQAQVLPTLAGLAAIALWGTLASLTALAGPIPAFQLTAMSFAIATAVGLAWSAATRQSLATLADVPTACWLLGVYGLFGYHAAYFVAMKLAPAVEVTVINYLWPLVIVLLSGLLPAAKGGGPLRWFHICGAVLGFAGAALVPLSAGAGLSLSGSTAGYALAVVSAVIWGSYSVGSRLFATVPTSAVTVFCALSAICAASAHLLLESTLWPLDGKQWLVVLAQGLGPVGIAFFLWDVGMKRGNLRLLGIASYATPLLATGLLILLGLGTANALLWAAVALVVVGALLGAADTLGVVRPRAARDAQAALQ